MFNIDPQHYKLKAIGLRTIGRASRLISSMTKGFFQK